MKFLYTALFVLAFSTFGFSQRSATASATSDFKTLSAGFVESVFTFNEPLSMDESSNILNWAKGNEPNLYITLSADKKQMTLKLSADYNQRALYGKAFYQLNIEDVIITENNQQIRLSTEAFFEKFNL